MYTRKKCLTEQAVFFCAFSAILKKQTILLFHEEESDYETEEETRTVSSQDAKGGLQYLYIQMEFCEKRTLRSVIDEGLYMNQDRVWRLLREIVEGLVHVHSQVRLMFCVYQKRAKNSLKPKLLFYNLTRST